MTRRSIVLCSDANTSSIDGSAMWLASLAETLSLTDSTVHVVLKAHDGTDRWLTRAFELPNVIQHPAVTVNEAHAMTIGEAVARLEDVVSSIDASIVIVNGSELAQACGQSNRLSARLWSYVTEFTFPESSMADAQILRLREIAATSHRLLVQTEECRSFVENIVPEAAGKCLLMTPTVPDEFFVELDSPPADDSEFRLIHSGKVDPEGLTVEIMEIVTRLEERGCRAKITMLADESQSDDAAWLTTTHQTLEDPSMDVRWRGNLSTEETVREMAGHDVGLRFRTSTSDDLLRISTEVLEYAASGTPPLISRTPAHEALLGRDYPLFVDDDMETVVTTLLAVRGRLPEIRRTAQDAVRPYASIATAHRLEACFRHTEPNLRDFPLRATRLKVVLAGHDLKFAGDLIDILEMRPDIELRIDRWTSLFKHDQKASSELAEWADTIVCEWAGNNAVWYSKRKRPDQRLIVRLHRYEVTGSWIDNIDMDKIDSLITVSPHYHQLVRESKPWPKDRTHYIPNSLNAMDLNRPKHAGAVHALAIVGIVPFLKRPDRALDLLEALLEHDPDFVLHVKGRMPWEYPWAWRDPAERESYLDFFARMGNTPGLPEHVVFAPFSPDMANWLRGIGWVLSPSTQEGFHLAPAEGMASGALPLFWQRDGVEMIFGDEYLFESIDNMARFVLETVHDEQDRARRAEAVKKQVNAFDTKTVADMWMTHILPTSSQ